VSIETGREHVYADAALASRLEGLAAQEMRRFVIAAHILVPDGPAETLEVAGGVAVFIGEDSPVNQAYGLGFAGVVTPDDADAIERFYVGRGARPMIAVSPLADESLASVLGCRGWVVDGFENVLVRELSPHDAFETDRGSVEIREVVTDEDKESWALVAATGFSAPLPPLDAQLDLGRVVVRRAGTRLFLAYVDGVVAGTGEMTVDDGVAWLSADSTLPRFRGRGVQQAMQRHRLAIGVASGCELAVTESVPGSGSQRNMERLGFRIAYTRVEMVLPSRTSAWVAVG